VYQLTELLVQTWENVRAQLTTEDIRKRLARRQSRSFTACPRAWCLVIRASDRRINDYYGWHTPYHPHDVTLTTDLIRRLVKPIRTERPHSEKSDLARELGITPASLTTAIRRGVFSVRRIPLLGGKPGYPTPLLSSDKPLDPANSLFESSHPLWTTQWKYLSDHVPADIEQPVRRIPHFRRFGLSRAEHRARPPRPYDPPKDYVFYRWTKDGNYIFSAHDIRRAHQRQVERRRRIQKRYDEDRAAIRAGKPVPSESTLRPWIFLGYRFVCPLCLKQVPKIFYPLPVYHAIKLLDYDYFDEGHPAALPACPNFFACHNCHRIRRFSLTNPSASWNELVTHLSAGLLYGHEVPKPEWFPKPLRQAQGFSPGSESIVFRKRAYTRHLTRHSPRRHQVAELLLRGHTRNQISKMMRITRAGVDQHCLKLYAQLRVHNLRQLAEALNQPAPPRRTPIRDAVQRLLLQGQRYEDIANRLGNTRSAICTHASAIYKEHNVHSRRALAIKLNLTLPTRRPQHDLALKLFASGQTYSQIAARLNITRASAWRHIKHACAENHATNPTHLGELLRSTSAPQYIPTRDRPTKPRKRASRPPSHAAQVPSPDTPAEG
jgi:DNA-binding CsgD family transcriptional regulator